MYKLLLILFLFAGAATYGQQVTGNWNPFTLVIIAADTAILDTSLYSSRDVMVAEQQKQYHQAVNGLEEQLNCVDCPKDSSITKELRDQLSYLKSMENEVKHFQCHHLLSSYSKAVYQFYFNEYKPFSTIKVVPKQKTDLASLAQLADTSKADYIVFFSNIRSVYQAGNPVLKLTTSLYSQKDKKIILSKETEVDVVSKGEMWACTNKVTCMFINGVKSSTDEVFVVLAKRQSRKKSPGSRPAAQK
jgi:hypothetical protein